MIEKMFNGISSQRYHWRLFLYKERKVQHK